jgi:hypothetical protein
MTCYKCPDCEIELCIGGPNPSDTPTCPNCNKDLKAE